MHKIVIVFVILYFTRSEKLNYVNETIQWKLDASDFSWSPILRETWPPALERILQNYYYLSCVCVCVCVCVRAHAHTYTHTHTHSVVSDSLQPSGLQPTRLLCPWDFLGKNTGVGCHFLLSRGSSWPRDCTHASCASCISRILYHCATWEAH